MKREIFQIIVENFVESGMRFNRWKNRNKRDLGNPQKSPPLRFDIPRLEDN